MPKLNLAGWIDSTGVEGPGNRFALWVQGCNIRCSGCCNDEMFTLLPKNIIDTHEVVDMIARSKKNNGIEGVTFLGGEPVLQARGLSFVASEVRKLGLTVMMFSGFKLEVLRSQALTGVDQLLKYTDILVDGPFIADKPELKRNWVGSTNQQFHFLTDSYQPGIEFDPQFSPAVEFRINSDSGIKMNGWPIDQI
jgi:anaerobic ribonucleoside-triphosphate reductase activating protein